MKANELIKSICLFELTWAHIVYTENKCTVTLRYKNSIVCRVAVLLAMAVYEEEITKPQYIISESNIILEKDDISSGLRSSLFESLLYEEERIACDIL